MIQRSESKKSLLVASLTAIGASVCCVGPLVLLTLGVGGSWASTLTAFEPVRPIFIKTLKVSSRENAPNDRCYVGTYA